jgi:hypothetical protein
MSPTLKIILYIIGGIIAIYLFSRLQMKAWLHEINVQLGEKFIEKTNNLKTEKDEGEEE